jgi:hypothetical protein
MERSLVAIILKRIPDLCVNIRFFYLLERTFSSGISAGSASNIFWRPTRLTCRPTLLNKVMV